MDLIAENSYGEMDPEISHTPLSPSPARHAPWPLMSETLRLGPGSGATRKRTGPDGPSTGSAPELCPSGRLLTRDKRSDSALPITDRAQRRSAWRVKSPTIPHRWLAEETAVFAAELAGTFPALPATEAAFEFDTERDSWQSARGNDGAA